MKVLFINGSPRRGGNTDMAIEEMKKIFDSEGVETETIRIGGKAIRGCMACMSCKSTGKCVISDEVNETAQKLALCDGVVVASPVYFASANGTLIAFLDRLFYSISADMTMKVGACVTIARRGGCSSTFDELNKYFTVKGMALATSQYWNSVHGRDPKEALKDEEGMQVMRTLAKNMVFLMRSIALGKEAYGLPEKEEKVFTNFILDDKIR